jgi:tetratricopeptide (TPR) repeat protein
MAEIKRSAEAEELFKKAESSLLAENREKAVAEYGEVLALLPNDDDSFTYHYTKTSKTITKHEVYKRRHNIYFTLDQPEKALDEISKAISITGDDAKYGYHFDRAHVYLALGEFEKAKADVEKDAKAIPSTAGIKYYGFGKTVEEKTGNKREAAVYLKKAIEHGDDQWDSPGESKKLLAEWGM